MSEKKNPVAESKKKGSRRGPRGGSWYGVVEYASVAPRYGNDAGYRYFHYGFRIARTKK